MLLTKDQLKDRLRIREIAPAYTFFGDESYLRDAAVRYITDLSFGDGEFRDFNETEFSLDNPENLKAALAAAEQLPMMAARRVIRITDVRVAVTANRDTLKEDFLEAITAYLERPAETSVLIFVADELNGNRKLGKLLKEKTTCVDFSRLVEDDLRKWAADRFKERNAIIESEVVDQVIELAGNDLHRLANEIEKLSAASLPEGRITADLVTLLVPYTREFSNFLLADELVAGRKLNALRMLKKMLDDGADPLALLGMLAWNYRRLLIAHGMLAQGEPRHRVEQLTRVRGSALAFAGRAGTGTLAGAIDKIARADIAIKTSAGGSGPAGARLQLEMLVCELSLI
ncbi:MAG: DNA polymerase III subunit delta [Pyrinomonadaceae bacterium]